MSEQQTLDGSSVSREFGRLGGLSLSGHILLASPPDATWAELRRWYRLAAEAGVTKTHMEGPRGRSDRAKAVEAVIREDLREHGREGDWEGADVIVRAREEGCL